MCKGATSGGAHGYLRRARQQFGMHVHVHNAAGKKQLPSKSITAAVGSACMSTWSLATTPTYHIPPSNRTWAWRPTANLPHARSSYRRRPAFSALSMSISLPEDSMMRLFPSDASSTDASNPDTISEEVSALFYVVCKITMWSTFEDFCRFPTFPLRGFGPGARRRSAFACRAFVGGTKAPSVRALRRPVDIRVALGLRGPKAASMQVAMRTRMLWPWASQASLLWRLPRARQGWAIKGAVLSSCACSQPADYLWQAGSSRCPTAGARARSWMPSRLPRGPAVASAFGP